MHQASVPDKEQKIREISLLMHQVIPVLLTADPGKTRKVRLIPTRALLSKKGFLVGRFDMSQARLGSKIETSRTWPVWNNIKIAPSLGTLVIRHENSPSLIRNGALYARISIRRLVSGVISQGRPDSFVPSIYEVDYVVHGLRLLAKAMTPSS